MQRVMTVVVAAALALTVAGLALIPLLSPWFTETMSARFSAPEVLGLQPAQTALLAEQAREFVAGGGSIELTPSADPRAGFDAASISHLADVRRVINGSRVVTGLLAGALTIWLAFCLVKGRFADIVAGLRAGAVACVALVGAALVFGVVSFDALFAWFHSLFFAAGTWQFPMDSMLIVLFPEGFWMAAGIVWAGLILLGGGLLWLAAGSVAKTGENRSRYHASHPQT